MKLQELLVDRYAVLHNLSQRSIDLYTYTIDRFSDFLGRPAEIADIDDLNVSKFCRWRATTPHRGRLASPASVRKDLAHLVALANHAAKKRYKGRDGQPLEFLDLPRNLVRVPTKQPKGYTVDEVSRIVRAAWKRDNAVGPVPAGWFFATLVMAAWYSGERVGALLRIRWSEADLEHGQLTFLGDTRKGGIETISRPIPPELIKLLADRRRAPNERIWPWLDYRSTQNTIYQSLRLVCESAGVEARGFHAIRKASGSYVAAAGGDATSHLSHADAKTTKRHYLDPAITGIQSALDYLPPLDLGPGRQPPPAADDSPGDRPAA
jgi:integrase